MGRFSATVRGYFTRAKESIFDTRGASPEDTPSQEIGIYLPARSI
jgi:hypothetical protein